MSATQKTLVFMGQHRNDAVGFGFGVVFLSAAIFCLLAGLGFCTLICATVDFYRQTINISNKKILTKFSTTISHPHIMDNMTSLAVGILPLWPLMAVLKHLHTSELAYRTHNSQVITSPLTKPRYAQNPYSNAQPLCFSLHCNLRLNQEVSNLL